MTLLFWTGIEHGTQVTLSVLYKILKWAEATLLIKTEVGLYFILLAQGRGSNFIH